MSLKSKKIQLKIHGYKIKDIYVNSKLHKNQHVRSAEKGF